MSDVSALDDIAARAIERLAARPSPTFASTAPATPIVSTSSRLQPGQVPTLAQLYSDGMPLECFDDVRANTLVLFPLRKPTHSAGGVVVTADEEKGTMATAAICYRVVGVGRDVPDPDSDSWIPCEAGDVVVVRNAMIEPLHPTLVPCSIARRHVLAKIKLADI